MAHSVGFGVRHKYRAVRTEREGQRFDSKLEALYYDHLVLLQREGTVVGFLRQVPFLLPGGVRYVCDFEVFYSDGRVRFEDVKGMETPEFKMKKKLVETLYPWIGEIHLIKKGDF